MWPTSNESGRVPLLLVPPGRFLGEGGPGKPLARSPVRVVMAGGVMVAGTL